jgi:hypothetical protein
MAARYVVDRSGIVRRADVNPDYTVRPDPQDTLHALEQQSKAGRVTR